MRFLLTGLTCAGAVSLAMSSAFMTGAVVLLVVGLPLASAAAETSRSALNGVAAGTAFGFASGHALVPALRPEWLDSYYDRDVVDMAAFGVVLGLGLATTWLLSGKAKLAIAGLTVLGLAVAVAYAIAFGRHSASSDILAYGTLDIYVDPVSVQPAIGVAIAISLTLGWIAHRLGGLDAVRWTLLGIALAPVLSFGVAAAAGTLLAGLAGAVTGTFLDKTGERRLPWEAIGAVAVAVGIIYRPLAVLVAAGCAFAFSYGYVRADAALKKIRSDNIIPLALGGVALVTVGTILQSVFAPSWVLSAFSLTAASVIVVIAVSTWAPRTAD